MATKNTYEDQIESWHALRESSLKKETGWLALVAGDWLKEGTNAIPGLGTIALNRGKVNVQLASGLQGSIGHQPFASGAIRTEADKGGPDRVRVGTRSFIVIKRGERFVLRLWDAEADARREFKGINRYPVSSQWRIEAQWEPYEKPRTVSLRTTLKGYNEACQIPGEAVFFFHDTTMRLQPIAEEGSDQLVFIFSDETSGVDTNANGRYLYGAGVDRFGVILDFNKAINPPCAFTSYATCPLPPESNRMKFRIEAGEMSYDVRFRDNPT